MRPGQNFGDCLLLFIRSIKIKIEEGCHISAEVFGWHLTFTGWAATELLHSIWSNVCSSVPDWMRRFIKLFCTLNMKVCQLHVNAVIRVIKERLLGWWKETIVMKHLFNMQENVTWRYRGGFKVTSPAINYILIIYILVMQACAPLLVKHKREE